MLIDQFGREVNYLRISVTERCNFRCLYCMPEKPFSWVPKENILSFEELFIFVKTAIDSGINKIRITGGEPTLREDLDNFLKMIHDYNPNIDLALTTNGFLMGRYAQRYADAGLKRINMSLDSLKEEVVNRIAKRNVYKEVIAGIEATKKAGLKIKLNTVPMKGINDKEILDLLEYAKSENIAIRYIEYMENNYADQTIEGLCSDEILDIIRSRYEITKVDKDESSPAQYYALPCGYEFGIIEPHKDDFCKSCNRIRLTAEGFLIPCLYFDEALSIKEFVQKGDVQGAAKVLETILATKPEKNRWIGGDDKEVSTRAFYETGG
jgi:GTP 3',8-cyclase